ncbi:MAG: dTDP-4-dehydrorhamnose reductase [Acidobacteriota bacterium]
MTRPIVVTGAAGQLGRTLLRGGGGTIPVVGLTRTDLDITRDDEVRAKLEALRPSAILNCASDNDVDAAEDHPDRALDVNAFGVRTLAQGAEAIGATLVHYSTDFVFAGTATRPYLEADAPEPQSVYAASKLLGEWLAGEAPGAYVLRVESLFGAEGPRHGRRSSLDTIVERIRAGHEVPVFTDRTVSPSYVHDVANATFALLDLRPEPGLYHCVNGGVASWYEIAEEAARILGVSPNLKPLTLADVNLRAPRPKYCALSNAKLAAAGIRMPAWQEALRRYLEGLLSTDLLTPDS